MSDEELNFGYKYEYQCVDSIDVSCAETCVSLEACQACDCAVVLVDGAGGPWGNFMDVFFCLLPIIFLIWATLKKQPLPTTTSLPTAAFFMYLVRLMYLQSDPLLTNAAVILGFHEALTPLSIMAGAITLFETMEATYCLPYMMREIKVLTAGHPAAELMLIFCFAYMIEGASGFGTPVALGAPMLVSSGHPPFESVVVLLIFNTFATVWGAVGTPIWFGFGSLNNHLTDDDFLEVSQKAGVALAVGAFLLIPLVLRILVPFPVIKANIRFVTLSLITVIGPSLGISFVSYEFPALIGGMIGCAGTAVLISKKVGLYEFTNDDDDNEDDDNDDAESSMSRGRGVVDPSSSILGTASSSKQQGLVHEQNSISSSSNNSGNNERSTATTGSPCFNQYRTKTQSNKMSEAELPAAIGGAGDHPEQALEEQLEISLEEEEEVEVNEDSRSQGSAVAESVEDSAAPVIEAAAGSSMISNGEEAKPKRAPVSFGVDDDDDVDDVDEDPAIIADETENAILNNRNIPLAFDSLSAEDIAPPLVQASIIRDTADEHFGPRKTVAEGYYQEMAARTFPIWAVVLLLILTRVENIGIKEHLIKREPSFSIYFGSYGTFKLSASLVFSLQNILTYPNLNWKYELLYVPFLIPFVLVSVAAMIVYRKDMKCQPYDIAKTVGGRLKNPAIALMGALVLVQLLIQSGTAAPAYILGTILSDWFEQAFVIICPLLGCLGAFFSGSTTVSNLTFGEIQRIAAESIGVSTTTMLALQAVGASAGNGVCLNNIIAACAVVGLNTGEGKILVQTYKYVFANTTIATIVMLAFYFRF